MLSVTFTDFPEGDTLHVGDYGVGAFDTVRYEYRWRSPQDEVFVTVLIGRRHGVDQIIGLQTEDFFWVAEGESSGKEYLGFAIREI